MIQNQRTTPPEASRSESLPGLEDDTVPRARGYKPGRADVERLATEITSRWRRDNPRAILNAAAQRAATRILDDFRTTPDAVLAALDWGLTDEFWGAGSKLHSWPALDRNLASLLRQMRTSGPAAAVAEPVRLPAGADPLLADDEVVTPARERFLLERGVRPNRYSALDVEQRPAFLARVRRMPVVHGEYTREEAWIAWYGRLSGRTIEQDVPAWCEVPVR